MSKSKIMHKPTPADKARVARLISRTYGITCIYGNGCKNCWECWNYSQNSKIQSRIKRFEGHKDAKEPVPTIMHSEQDENDLEHCPECKRLLIDMPVNDIGPYCIHGNWQLGPLSKGNRNQRPMYYAYVRNY